MINILASLVDKMPTAQKGKGKPKAVFYPSLQQKASVVWTWQKCFSTDLNFLSQQTFIISHVQHSPKYKKYNNGHLKVSSRNQRAAWHLRKQERVPSTRNTQGRNSTGLRRTGALCWVIFKKTQKVQKCMEIIKTQRETGWKKWKQLHGTLLLATRSVSNCSL